MIFKFAPSMLFAIALSLTACGDDSSTSVNDGDGGSEAAMTSSSRHSGLRSGIGF